MKVAFIFLPPWNPNYPPYSMALFKSSTQKHNHTFIGFDLNNDLYHKVQNEDKKLWETQHANLWNIDCEKIICSYSDYLDSYIKNMLTNQIDLFSLSIIGYSKCLAFYVTKKIKEFTPNTQIFIGGPECFPAYGGINILKNKNIDAICTGEGDEIWPTVLNHFSKQKNLHINIPGFSYKKDDGTIIDNGVPELVKDLNSIPCADYSNVSFEKYYNKYHFSIMTSRGCINTCAFCSERPNFHTYRFRNAENIFNEIETHLNSFTTTNKKSISKGITQKIKKVSRLIAIAINNKTLLKEIRQKIKDLLRFNISSFSPYYISFNDSLINGKPKELERFCDLVIASDLRFSWGGMALLRKEMTYELLTKMKKAGCRNLAWGLESGCQEVLTLMHKKFFNMDLAKEIIISAHKAKISQSISLIAGFPGETEEMFLETKEFLIQFKDYFDGVGVQPMMIVKNSIVYDKYEQFGVESVDDFLRWQTTDGLNNYDIRQKRIEILKSVLGDKIVQIDR